MAIEALYAAMSALMTVQAAGGPPAVPAQPDTIVVTGSKSTRRAIENDVQNVTVDTDGQIAMFEQPICPASFGLPESYNPRSSSGCARTRRGWGCARPANVAMPMLPSS